MGYIYKIYNDVNDKIYIGQTTQLVKYRIKQHIKAAMNGIGESKLYRAIREIGPEHFHIETLGEYEDTKLNDIEVATIEAYDSFRNGYNSTLGGNGTRGKYVPDFVDDLIEDYLNGISQVDIAIRYGVSRSYIVELTRGLTRQGNPIQSHYSIPDFGIYNIYDTEFKFVKQFQSLPEAYNEVAHTDIYDFRREITIACYSGNIAYGYRWQLQNLLHFNGKYFRSIFDIENYTLGIGKTIEVSGIMQNSAITEQFKIKRNTCKLCGKTIDKKAEICLQCYNKQRDTKIQGTNTSKPSKKELELLVKQKSLMEIGRMYGVHGNSVKKWCIKLGIDYKNK